MHAVAVARKFEWPQKRLNLPKPLPVDPISASATSRIEVISVAPAEIFHRPLPALPADLEVRPYFHEHSIQYSVDQYVAVLTGGSAWGCSHGAVFTCLGEFVPTFARDPWGPALHEVWRRPYLPAPKRVRGRALYLVTPEAADNYHHWMIDLLPRIGLVETAGFDLKAFDQVIIDYAARPYQLETLQRLGIDPRRIVRLSAGDRIQPDELVVPSLKTDNQDVPLNQLEWLRKKFSMPVNPAARRRRFYLSRAEAPTRRLLNEGEVFAMLQQLGFEKVNLSRYGVREQAALLASAEMVAGPSGAAFTNTVFCAPGTQVIEFASPRWLTVYHWMISARLGLEHTILMGEGAAPDRKLRINGRSADLEIDVSKLSRVLQKLTNQSVA